MVYNSPMESKVKNGWLCCPYCGKRLFPVRPDTVVRKLPYKCRACRNEFEVNIQSQEPLSQEPID
ncbi:MAG TPA: hypothetical protein H9666_04225 [Firmicutes bacterium]|nr:hypothetical protein [Bacillota bacterium]